MRIAIHDYAGHPFVFELSRQLAHSGHEVRHFFFEGDPGPKGDARTRDDDASGFSVQPINISAAYRKDQLLRRRRQDIEYGRNAGAAIAAFKPDVVLSGNTPLEAQAPLLAAARRVGAGFVFWMQDFYSLAVRGILGPKFFGAGALAAAWYERLESTLLNRSDKIVVISDDFLPGLEQLNVGIENVEIIPNWGALNAIPLRPKVNDWSERSNLSNKFIFLYSGTLGLKHDPMLLLALSEAMEQDPAVQIVVAASGAGFEELKLLTSDRPRPNLTLKGLEPIEVLPDALAAADVVVALLEPDAGRYSVPSKVLSYLCAAKPVLLSAPKQNLASRIVDRARAGRTVAAGDRAAFVAAATEMRANHALRQDMGAAGRAYAEGTFDVSKISERFLEVFASIQGREDLVTRAA